MSSTSITTAKDVIQRVEARDWNHILQDLDSHGNAIMENLISSNECDALVNLYSEDNIFRSRVVMEAAWIWTRRIQNTLTIHSLISLLVFGLVSTHI